MDNLTVSERLAKRLARPVDAAARARAALHVLDWAGCAVAGARSDAARAMAKVVGPADVLYLGALGNVLEMDDVDKRALLHPGPVVGPAAFVAANTVGADGEAFLDAVVRGYEAVIRVGRAVGPGHYRYWHNTGTVGPFGAAAAAASVLRLDADQTASALGLAGTQASGFWQVRHEPSSHAKQLHTARAAHGGLLAARLADSGFAGLKTLLEGPQGFFAATCPGADAEAVSDFPADAPWTIFDVSFKPWPACRHAHAAIDAALALRERGLDAQAVERVTVRAYRDAIVFCDKPAPGDTLSAKFSLQHAVSVALLRGAPALADFEIEARNDPAVARLREKVAVAEDAAITALYPARFGAAIDVALADGGCLSVDVPDALGDPENPVDEGRIVEKAQMLMAAGGLDRAAAAALIDNALALADGGDFTLFADAMMRSVRQ